MITQQQVAEAVCKIYKQAAITLPEDIVKALNQAYENEISGTEQCSNVSGYRFAYCFCKDR